LVNDWSTEDRIWIVIMNDLFEQMLGKDQLEYVFIKGKGTKISEKTDPRLHLSYSQDEWEAKYEAKKRTTKLSQPLVVNLVNLLPDNKSDSNYNYDTDSDNDCDYDDVDNLDDDDNPEDDGNLDGIDCLSLSDNESLCAKADSTDIKDDDDDDNPEDDGNLDGIDCLSLSDNESLCSKADSTDFEENVDVKKPVNKIVIDCDSDDNELAFENSEQKGVNSVEKPSMEN
jgi:hypothetical protein